MEKIILFAMGLAFSTQPMTSTPATTIGKEWPKPQIQQVITVKETRTVWLTAYSSTPEETDDTPFITAMGTKVHDGIVATNALPMGTKIRIPEVFGNKIFTVEDRMHKRKTGFVDIWMSNKKEALQFGIMKAKIQILGPTPEEEIALNN